MAERPDALNDQVQSSPLFRVLGHEHLMQTVEVRTRDVPVKVMRHEVQRIAVGEQSRKASCDVLAFAGVDADVN
jgi:hypothetical protein